MQLSSFEARNELQRRALAELARRRQDPSFTETVISALREELFDRQIEVLDDRSRRVALCCSRRGGKSELAARMIAIELMRAKHNEYVLFAARTLQRARQIIWPLLTKINDTYALGWRCSEHIGQIVTPAGGVFTLLGVDDALAAEKVRGSKYRLAVCDESATYEEHLERLVVDCIEPGTMDFSPPGRIVLCGTPGYVRAGYWHSVSCGIKPGWSHYAWTLKENPWIPDADNALLEIRKSNGWAEDDPTYQREYLGRWTADESTLVYAFNETRNITQTLPEPPDGVDLDTWIRDSWLTTLGADIGYTDAFAIAVLGSPPHSQDIYVLYAHSQTSLLAGEQAELIRQSRERYKPTRVVVDAGGQGKLVLAEFNERYGRQAGGRALAALKTGKLEAIGQFNSDMRIGRIKAHVPHAQALVHEWAGLAWATEAKDLEHPGFDNHTASSALYAWRVHKSFLAKPAPGAATPEEVEEEKARRRNREALQEREARRRR